MRFLFFACAVLLLGLTLSLSREEKSRVLTDLSEDKQIAPVLLTHEATLTRKSKDDDEKEGEGDHHILQPSAPAEITPEGERILRSKMRAVCGCHLS